MKKNIFAITAAAALVLNIAATSVTTFAADGTLGQADATGVSTIKAVSGQTSATTHGKIEMTTKSDDGKGTEQGISLDSAPDINFGTHTITGSTKTYNAESTGDPIQVTNPGYADGWTVSLKAGAFTNDTDKTSILRGAVLSLTKADVTRNNTNSAAGVATDFTGTSTDGSDIFVAGAGSGIGVNQAAYKAENVTLEVPAGNVAGSYTADLVWTLSSTANTKTGSVDGQQ